MFDYIKGDITDLKPTAVVIETGQIGFLLNVSLNTYAKIEGQANAKLYIHEVIREDSFTLYGFAEKEERDAFLLLISVSGVGTNTARTILSSFSVEELCAFISSGNVNQLKGIKGIGLKTAQRIIVDLKDKMEGISSCDLTLTENKDREEALAALTVLGFLPSNSTKVVDAILKDSPTLPLEKLIKEALKRLR